MIEISNPSYRQIGPATFALAEEFTVVFKDGHHASLRFVVPEGFVTDFASSPMIAGWLIQKQGDFNRAAILHDYLYRRRTTSRFLADALFRDLMRELNVPLWRRIVMYYAVRAFGWISWRKGPCRDSDLIKYAVWCFLLAIAFAVAAIWHAARR